MRPSASEVERFRDTYAAVLARKVVVSPAPSWLPDGTGLALATSAPGTVFSVATGRPARVRTLEGWLTVRALAEPEELGTLPLSLARSAIARELGFESRSESYAAWTLRKQRGAEGRLVCTRDRLPEVGVNTLSSFVPFLALHEAISATTTAAVTR